MHRLETTDTTIFIKTARIVNCAYTSILISWLSASFSFFFWRRCKSIIYPRLASSGVTSEVAPETGLITSSQSEHALPVHSLLSRNFGLHQPAKRAFERLMSSFSSGIWMRHLSRRLPSPRTKSIMNRALVRAFGGQSNCISRTVSLLQPPVISGLPSQAVRNFSKKGRRREHCAVGICQRFPKIESIEMTST